MPHSLRAKLSGLRYKKIISDKDYDRLCKALDNENVIDKIRAEINRQEKWLLQAGYTAYNVDMAFDAIKSVVAESEETDADSN